MTSSPEELGAGVLRIQNFQPIQLPEPEELRFEPPPIDDPTWSLYWRGLTWVGAMAMYGYSNVAVRYAEAYAEQVGSVAKDEPGWDEGTVSRRLAALTCLASFRRSRTLDELIDITITAAMDPDRYPNRPFPSNHVILLNRALIDAGGVLNRPDAVEVGLTRLANDWRQVWLTSGFDQEQSSAYLDTNIRLWSEVAALFEQHGRTEDATALRELLERSRRLLAFFTTPDGTLTAVGDSHVVKFPEGPAGFDGPLVTDDHDAGMSLGRTSWNSDATGWTLRHSDRRRFHGHYDALSLTWFAGGVPVLIDPGFFTYDQQDWRSAWARSPAAHNTAFADRGAVVASGGGALRDHQETSQYHLYDLVSVQTGVPHVRRVAVFVDRPTVVVIDRIDGPFRQHWHLDPAWAPADPGTWHTPEGATLRLITTGTAERFSGQEGRGGFVFDGFRSAVPAEQIDVQASDIISTVFSLGDQPASVDPEGAVTIGDVTIHPPG